MKASLLILAVAVLVVVALGIGVAMNHFGGHAAAADASTAVQTARVTEPVTDSSLNGKRELVFETTDFPPEENVGRAWELKKSGHADFWFTNPHDSEIRFGLRLKSSNLPDIAMFVSNAEWNAWHQRNLHVRTAAAVAGPVTTLYLQQQEAEMHRRESELTRYDVNALSNEGFVIPARARGWIRLNWSGENSGHYSQLPKKLSLIFGCSTRTRVNFKGKAVQESPRNVADLFVVGEPVALTCEEINKLPIEHNRERLQSAYRVPVTLMDQIGERLVDAGALRRVIKITINDEDIEPLEIPLTGTIEGVALSWPSR